MHTTILLQKIKWLSGKGVDIYPWGSRNQFPQLTRVCGHWWYLNQIFDTYIANLG
jgi:hypothetical protein